MKKILIFTLLVFSASVLCKDSKSYEKWKQSMREHYSTYDRGNVDEGMLEICKKQLAVCIEKSEDSSNEGLKKASEAVCFAFGTFCVDEILMKQLEQGL